MNPSVPAPAPRLVSLDALRGFDMFWILGADSLVVALGALTHFPPARAMAAQLDHKPWAGFAFYDLIFPLFVFIVGVSLVFSLTPQIARADRAAAVTRILRRAALLFLLGIFYNGGLTHPWPEVRLLGVLPRIAFAYACAGLLFVFCRPRTLAVVTATILLGYWALLALVPIRDLALDRATFAARLGTPDPTLAQAHALFDATTARTRGHYEPGFNLPNHVDFQFLPGALYDRYYDPEGIVSSPPAVATCLLGVFAGLLLRSAELEARAKLRRLLLAGALSLAAGWLWHFEFPVIKKLWTSSFVLVAGGWSFLLLAALYYIVDVRGWRRWCRPFVWIGMNPITLYLVANVVSFPAIASRLVGGSVRAWFDAHVAPGFGGIVVTCGALALVFAFARFLYRRQIFLRV